VEKTLNIEIPDLESLKGVFETIKKSTYKGIDGVMCFDSGKPGSTVGITICTHGNEPVGLATLWHFLKNEQKNELYKGRVIFVLNNIKATEKYFAAQTEEEKYFSRFIDINMNRLPDSLEASLSAQYEVVRAQELLPVWEDFDMGMDVHSTSVASDPMMLLRHGSGIDVVKGFPVTNIISGFSNVMQGNTAMDFYGPRENRAHTILLEAGCHESAEAFKTAIACVDALFCNLDIFEREAGKVVEEYNHYRVCASVLFPDETYKTAEIFPNFAFVTEGTCLATGSGEDIIAVEDGHVLMCFSTGKPPTPDEEALFISLPVEKVVFTAGARLKRHAS
jgi:succinylglutamate desuccinylase